MVTDREIQILIRFLKENKIFVETSIKMDEAIDGFWKNKFFKPDVSKLNKDVNWRWFSTEWQKYYEKNI